MTEIAELTLEQISALIYEVMIANGCDDANAAVHPDAPGTGEGIDNNCDGILSTDEEDPSSCPEDLNQDGSITVADVLAVLAEFGCTTDCSVDVDDNGTVNVSDVLALLAAFDTDC